MGSAFGHMPDNGINLALKPEVTPHPLKEPTFDPQLGFSSERKIRTIKATRAELESAKIPLKARDYCSDSLLKFQCCRKDNFPFVVKCEHEKHEYLNCQHEDYMQRMKEYERERRLMVREHKRKQAEAAGA